MEKQWKPVPDIECLKYHGTPGKPDIKIFVSHRIDLDSETIDNPIYIPVRCGAVFDEREGITMLGDDTGDNISEKRNSFCELTVQYWAWKNVEADYYGLYHYRRYLNFSSNVYSTDPYENILDKCINGVTIEKYALEKFCFEGYDIILPKIQDVSGYPQKYSSVWNQYAQTKYLYAKDLQKIFRIIEMKYPAYINVTKECLYGKKTYMCNLFIMRKELFYAYSEWLFSILKEFESVSNFSQCTLEEMRAPGYLAERLLTIFIFYQKSLNRDLKIIELQPVVFLKAGVEVNWFSTLENPVPKFRDYNIPIVLSCSNLYVPYAGTVIQSIIDYATPNNNYDIILIESELSCENIKRIKSLVHPQNISIRIIHISSEDNLSNAEVSGYFSVETYIRLLLPYMLRNYEKVIWLDADTLVQADVAQLYNIDIGSHLLGATQDYNATALLSGMDTKYKEFCLRELKIEEPNSYFQAGVLLMNLNEFRKSFTMEEIFDLISHCKYPYADQDILNRICRDRIYLLDNRWDVIADVQDCLSNVLKWWTHESLYNHYQIIKEEPWIIHFAGPTKPWHSPDNAMADRFWAVCRKTPFYETAFGRMVCDMNSGIERYSMNTKEKRAHLSTSIHSIGERFCRCLSDNGLRYTFFKIFHYIFMK